MRRRKRGTTRYILKFFTAHLRSLRSCCVVLELRVMNGEERSIVPTVFEWVNEAMEERGVEGRKGGREGGSRGRQRRKERGRGGIKCRHSSHFKMANLTSACTALAHSVGDDAMTTMGCGRGMCNDIHSL